MLHDDALDDPGIAAFAFGRLVAQIREARIRASQTFADAELRIARAEGHLADLRRRLDEWVKTQETGVRQTPEGMVGLRHSGPPLPRVITLIIGEAIQNLRTALDYLVYALTWLDSETHRDQTQFPIVDREEAFESQRFRLSGLSDEHREAIRALQPFAGCEWIGSLRDASNQDKHWALSVAIAQGSGVARNIGQPDFETEFDVRLVLDDDTPIFDWLEQLIANVTAVLTEFKSDFDRPVVLEFGGIRQVLQKTPR
jgi:hypothetical protein